MKRQIRNHTRNTEPALAPPVQLTQLQSRPWGETIESLNPDLETSELIEAEPVPAKFGHNLADIPLEAPDPPPAEPNTSVPNVQADFERELNQAKAGGSPLDNAFREQVEPVMGADFSGVKVHTDAKADRLNESIQAKAFTTGQDIFFKQGEYEPGSQQGQELLAHELTHVVQQGGAIRPKRISGKSLIQKLNDDQNGKLTEYPYSLNSLPDSDIIQKFEGEVCELTETEAYYSDYVNESNLNDSAEVRTLTESTTKQEEDPNKPIFEEYKGESVNKVGYVGCISYLQIYLYRRCI